MKRVIVALASLVGLAGSGCVLPPIGDALLLCTADADCPSSQVCVLRTDDTRLCRPAGEPCVATVGGVTAEQPDGSACGDVDGGICLAGACVAPRCGDGVVSGTETCDGDEGCRADCSRCGDGTIDDGEVCDDGDDNSDVEPGACRTTCVPAGCGDGVRDPDEGCDDGDLNDDAAPGACRTSCARPACGDGVVDDGELCDEGADNSDTAPGACRTTCVPGSCGDGVIDPGEVCDDGPGNSDVQPNACRTTCVPARCGDRARDLDEACDDGDDNSDVAPDACRTTCQLASCGDGVVDDDEACDDGSDNGNGPDACRATCVLPACGDGVIDTGEQCDDGDDNSDTRASACRTDCVPAACGDGTIDLGEACDDGDLNSDIVADACRTDCARAACGDGIIDDGEVCDDNNRSSGDGCRADCRKVERCGDGELDPGERCDDENDNPRDGCDACRPTTWAVSVPLTGRALADDGGFALTSPGGVAVDAVGGLYIADTGAHRVLRRDPDGTVVVIAGTGAAGFSGDGGPAIAAELRGPTDVAVAPDGVVFIADHLNDRVRVVDTDGTIGTFAGGGNTPTNDGDGGLAALARLRRPRGVVASSDAVVIAEESGFRIRGVSRTALPLIDTIVGDPAREQVLPDGNDLFAGRLDRPVDVVFDGASLLFADAGRNPRVRRVRLVEGDIVTVAGGGGLPADTIPRTATSVSLQAPAGLVAGTNEFFFSDQALRRVFRVTGTQLVAVAGTGTADPIAAGQAPLETALRRPGGLSALPGVLFVADEGLHMVRQLTTTVTDLVGTGSPGVGTEGAAATSVTLVNPVSVVPIGEELLIADVGARRIFRRDAAGRLALVAGNGDIGQADEGAQALTSPLSPGPMVRRADGTLVVAEVVSKRSRLLEILPTGTISVLAQVANQFLSADAGGLLLTMDGLGRVVLGGGFGIAVENPDNDGGEVPGFDVFTVNTSLLAIASETPDTVVALVKGGELARVSLDRGTFIGELTSIDGGIPEDARGLALSDEGIFVGSPGSGVRLLTPDGVVRSIVGSGAGRTGDGGPAFNATVADPVAIVVDGNTGRLLVVDGGAGSVRRLGPAPLRPIETVAGDLDPSGPGVLSQAALYGPQTLALLPNGDLIAGGAQGRLLRVSFAEQAVDVVVGHPSPSPLSRLPRFLPLLQAPTAFGVEDGVLRIVDDRRVLTIDATGPPSTWAIDENPRAEELLGATHVARFDDDHLAVTFSGRHCVQRLRQDTLAVVETLFGTCGSAGAFAGFIRDPGAVVVGPTGVVYVADTGNHRVLRRASPTAGAVVEVVIGDGSPSSAGQGSPARDFPLQSPGQLVLDEHGNLFIASTTTVRLVANVDGDADADGDDLVSTIYGREDREAFPQRASRCLAGLVMDEAANRIYVADACGGFLVALDIVDAP